MVLESFQTIQDQAITATKEPEIPSPQVKIIEADEAYGKFSVEPLEQGYAYTVGNPLRRILLSSLAGAAVTWVKIEGVLHEYGTIPGVKEDVIEFLLNVKNIRLRSLSGRPGKMRLEVSGERIVRAGDIVASSDFEIVNPEQHIATLDSSDSSLSVEFNVESGKGYVPAETVKGLPIGVLPVDAIFTPMRRVNYTVERMRVGQVTDYERLLIEVWTDKSIPPVEAVRKAAHTLVDHFFLLTDLGKETEPGEKSAVALRIPAEHYNTPIERLELSSRTLNCLKRANFNKVGQILEMDRSELLKIRNFGEKSAAELYRRLEEMGFLSKKPEDDGDAGQKDQPALPEEQKEEAASTQGEGS